MTTVTGKQALNEQKIMEELETFLMQFHEGNNKADSWGDGYDYVSIAYDGPSIDDDTGEPDNDSVMYIVSVDAHLSERIKTKDKYEHAQDYDNLYGWIFISGKYADVVGLDNFDGEDRLRLVKNLDTFLKHFVRKS